MHLGRDTTLRWSFRAGDFLFWMRWNDLWAASAEPVPPPNILDFWEMQDGYFATITNREADLPACFELHLTQVRDLLGCRMMAKIESGYEPPDEGMDGANLWRLRSGDRVAWVGEARLGQQAVQGILAILDCLANALLIGETSRHLTPMEFATFGAPSKARPTQEELAWGHAAAKASQIMGCPRTYDTERQLR